MRSDPINNSQVATDERIPERIVKDYELRLAMNLPEYNARFQHTTIITPQGAFQWNTEIEQWTCRMSVENFNDANIELNFLLNYASNVTNVGGESAYNLLTLKQVNMLDQALRLHHGDTIIGYTICEEIYLREINFFVWLFCQRCSQCDYPPLPDAYSKKILMFIQQPIVFDIAASLRVAAQSYLLFFYFLRTYFQYTPKNQDYFERFLNNNTPWILLAICSVIVFNLFLLRSGYIDKPRVLSAMMRLRWIEQSIIGMIINLINYGSFFLSATVIEDCFVPFIILGAVIGYYKHVREVINIAQWTTFQFLLQSFFASLTVGSFCAVGFNGLIDVTFFLYDDDFNSAEVSKYSQDQNITRYTAFTIMLFVSLFRFPHVSLNQQYFGQYASNVMNGISIALLDNYALTLLISNSIYTLNGSPYFSPQKPTIPAFLCILIALSFFSVFLVTFPTTLNLPKYSLEKNPIKPTWITKTLRFFNDVTRDCMSKVRRDQSRFRFISNVSIEFVSDSMTQFSRALSVNRFYPHIQREETLSVENPLQKNPNHFIDSEKNTLGNC